MQRLTFCQLPKDGEEIWRDEFFSFSQKKDGWERDT
jgi:hypothetical protein